MTSKVALSPGTLFGRGPQTAAGIQFDFPAHGSGGSTLQVDLYGAIGIIEAVSPADCRDDRAFGHRVLDLSLILDRFQIVEMEFPLSV